MKKLFLFLTVFTLSFISNAQEALWLRYPAISPDGQTILFNFKGDIYSVPSSGGRAIPLTLSDSYEYSAVWSNDGKQIAFASDRFGNFDIYVMPAEGGESTRLTYHSNNEKPSAFTADNSSIIFTGLRQDLHTHVQFPSGVMAELYSVPVKGGRVDQVLSTPAHDATLSSDGQKLIFHDRKGYENEWRKHHTSAVTRDIWTYDMSSGEYKQLSNFAGEDRNPVFAANNTDYYYLSEENGAFNIHSSSLENPGQNQAITNYTKHPARFLTISDDNTLCYSYDGKIYTLQPGGTPVELQITIPYEGRHTLDKVVKVNRQFTEASISPNGKEFAYVFRGEIFVSSLEKGTTKRITNTPWQERSVSFSPDGKSLVYAAEVNSSWNVYKTSIARDEEPYFYLSTLLNEETVVATDKEEFQPTFSPDGKEIAYLEDRQVLKVINLASKQSRTIMPFEYNYSYADGDQWYQWSPDSKWFLVSFGQPDRIFFDEVGLVEASGSGTIRNLTQSGYSDSRPKWAMDGKMMIWASDREGTRGESGWLNNGDIYAMYFDKETYDISNLNEEEYGIYKESKKEDKEDTGEEDSKNKKGKKAEPEKKSDLLTFDWDGLEERKKRLTIHTSQANDWLLSKDGEKLYYLTRFEGRDDLWVTDLRSRDTKLLAKIGGNNTAMELSKDGKFLLMLSDGNVMKISLPDGNVKRISTNGEMILKQGDERAYIFDHSWRQLREKFYVEDLQGVDWDFYYSEYKKFLPHINNSYDFAEMLSEMLGEMNASHTGARYRPRFENADQTASLGALYDYDHEGTGIKIAEILKKGPLDKAKSEVRAGHIIEKIDGETVTEDIDFYMLLNRKSGKNVLISVHDPQSGKRWDEVVKPFSLGNEYQILYKRWVDTRRADVEKLSNGKLGYVHVRGMNDPSMRTVIEEVLGKHIDDEALIVDTRFNGGGNLHDILSDFLNGKKWIEVIPHGQYVGYEPWNRWVKPSIVLMGESNYSDAHLFPVAYKIKNVGKTLGMPVPGTGTFVWWERQIDPTLVFGIPMGGWKPLGQPFLENNQLEPDIRVPNEPGMLIQGRDQQLEEAVKELLGE